MASLEKAAAIVLGKCMDLKELESCLVLTDESKLKIAKSFLREAEKITKEVKLVEIPVGKVSGEEPPSHVAEQMKEFDVIIITTTKSLSWTRARENATKSGARVASMPGITEGIMERAVDVPYEDMRMTALSLARILNMSREIEISTAAGTKLSLSVAGRKWKPDFGIYSEPGKWGNIPGGEVFVAPVEGTAKGTAVIDASMSGIGRLANPIVVGINKGYAETFSGGNEAKELKAMLDSIGSRKAFNIAELGIGINLRAKVGGNVLEDEKVAGTCHIAFGKNIMFGGKVDVPIHVDGVMNKPTIKADGRVILKEGKIWI